MKNEKIIKIFDELHNIYKSLGNTYRERAYKKIINKLKTLDKEIKTSNELKGIEGFGNRTLIKIDEILKTNKLKLLEELKKKNKSINVRIELQKIYGIGPKLANKYVSEYNLKSIDDFKKLVKEKKIKLTEQQMIGLKYYKDLLKPIPRNEIKLFTNKLQKTLHKKFKTLHVLPMGSYYRGEKTSGDIDLIIYDKTIKTKNDLLKSTIFNDIVDYLQEDSIIIDILSRGYNNISAIVRTNKNNIRQMDIRFSPYDLLEYFILYFGSGEELSRKMRLEAKEQGYKLSEWGLIKKD